MNEYKLTKEDLDRIREEAEVNYIKLEHRFKDRNDRVKTYIDSLAKFLSSKNLIMKNNKFYENS